MAVVRQTNQTVDNRPAAMPAQSAAGATIDAFGGNGEALQRGAANLDRMASALSENVIRMKERDDAVARARDYGDFTNFATQTLQTFQQGEDMSDPLVQKKFKETLEAKRMEMLGSHRGGPNSKADLDARLSTFSSGTFNQALSIGVEQGNAKVKVQLGEERNVFVQQVSEDPSQFRAALEEYGMKVADYGRVLPEAERANLMKTAVQAGVMGVVDTMLSSPNGPREVNRLFTSNPDLMRQLEPAAQASIRKAVSDAAKYDKELSLKAKQIELEERRTAAAEFEARQKVRIAERELAIKEKAAKDGTQQMVPAGGAIVGKGPDGKVTELYKNPAASNSGPVKLGPNEALVGLGEDGKPAITLRNNAPNTSTSQTEGDKLRDRQSVFEEGAGRKMNEQELQKLAGVDRAETEADKKKAVINLFQAMTNKAPTEVQIAQALGMKVDPQAQTEDEKNRAALSLYEEATGEKPDKEMTATLLKMNPPGGKQTMQQKYDDWRKGFTTAGLPEPTDQEKREFFGIKGSEKQTPEQKVAEINALRVGRGQPELTDVQVEALLNIRAKDLTLAEKIAEAEKVNGGPLDRAERAKMGNFYLSPDEKALAASEKPKAAPAEQKPAAAAPAQPAATDDAPAAAEAKPKSTAKSPSIYDDIPLVYGIANVGRRKIGETPDAIAGGSAPEQVQAKERLNLASEELVNTLQYSPLNAQKERQDLEEKFGDTFAGSAVGSAKAAQQKLIAFDDYLGNRQRKAEEGAANQTLSEKDRLRHAYNADKLAQFREKLFGGLTVVRGPEDYDKVGVGEEYINAKTGSKKRRAK